MAALAAPTWAEVQTMDDETLVAMNIIKGQMNGDEFIWDHEVVSEDGSVSYGAWKSTLDQEADNNDGKITRASYV